MNFIVLIINFDFIKKGVAVTSNKNTTLWGLRGLIIVAIRDAHPRCSVFLYLDEQRYCAGLLLFRSKYRSSTLFFVKLAKIEPFRNNSLIVEGARLLLFELTFKKKARAPSVILDEF